MEVGKGIAIGDCWTDIPAINSQARERLQYPTQKPLPLLERIIRASTEPGDLVLDPFCGCGTAIEAAERLGRQWIGIDVTYLAIHVIEKRLEKADFKASYSLIGRPQDADDARALAARDWLEFQKWAVLTLQGVPNERPGADHGIDGVIRYHRVGIEQAKKIIVSVKGGLTVGVDAIHKLKSVVDREQAEMGVLVCLNPPTPAMIREALSAGDVGTPSRMVRKLQIVTVDDIFERNPIDIPGTIDPPEVGRPMPIRQPSRKKSRVEGQIEMLLTLPGAAPTKPKRGRAIRDVIIDVVRPGRKES